MEWARATSGKEVERPLLKALGGLEPRTSPHPRSERQLVATGGSRARLSLCRFRRPARRSLAARRLESKKLGDEESDQPDRRRVAGVGSEEHGEKGRSDNKARDARPPQRHSRGGRQDVHRLLLARAPVRRSCLERREPLGKTRRSAAMQKRNLRVSFTWMPAPSVFGWRRRSAGRGRRRSLWTEPPRRIGPSKPARWSEKPFSRWTKRLRYRARPRYKARRGSSLSEGSVYGWVRGVTFDALDSEQRRTPRGHIRLNPARAFHCVCRARYVSCRT